MKKENKDLSLIKSFFKKHEYLLLTIISSLIVIIAIFSYLFLALLFLFLIFATLIDPIVGRVAPTVL